jgi:hypothetical protein
VQFEVQRAPGRTVLPSSDSDQPAARGFWTNRVLSNLVPGSRLEGRYFP